MRIWDLPVKCLCRNHLLAEHRELHAIWSVIMQNKAGYSRHPETLRWRGRLAALHSRHEEQVAEMSRRGYAHRSPLDLRTVPRRHRGRLQTDKVNTLAEQRRILRAKGCACEATKAGR